MEIKFYNVTDDNRVVNKTLGNVVRTVQAQVYDNCSIMTPRLLLAYHSDVVNSNYIHIPTWNRYYYITDVTGMPGNRCIVSCREDCLMSNRTQILTLDANVLRTEGGESNNLVVDSKMPNQANRHCKTIRFSGQPFSASDSNAIYLLTVVGGVSRGS